ncbi:hypothetical protein BDN67DRAFT_983007 [Paxillus ammoniavirescens]|nr:hypothetical protein BDN67DRAFT_983007 [Paxillus ammoniavirescens]
MGDVDGVGVDVRASVPFVLDRGGSGTLPQFRSWMGRLERFIDGVGGPASAPVSTCWESQLALLVWSPVSFILPSRWPLSSSTVPPNSSSTSFNLVSLSTPSSSGLLTQLDSLNSMFSTISTVVSTFSSPSTPHSPSFSSGGSVGLLGRRSLPSVVPTGFLGGFWLSGSSSAWSLSAVSMSSVSTCRLVTLILSPSSRTLGASARCHAAVVFDFTVSMSWCRSGCKGDGGAGGEGAGAGGWEGGGSGASPRRPGPPRHPWPLLWPPPFNFIIC